MSNTARENVIRLVKKILNYIIMLGRLKISGIQTSSYYIREKVYRKIRTKRLRVEYSAVRLLKFCSVRLRFSRANSLWSELMDSSMIIL